MEKSRAYLLTKHIIYVLLASLEGKGGKVFEKKKMSKWKK